MDYSKVEALRQSTRAFQSFFLGNMCYLNWVTIAMAIAGHQAFYSQDCYTTPLTQRLISFHHF